MLAGVREVQAGGLGMRHDAGPVSIGARDRVRTGDPQLGKLMLYQLSYSRVQDEG
jgi:hypothetical protein